MTAKEPPYWDAVLDIFLNVAKMDAYGDRVIGVALTGGDDPKVYACFKSTFGDQYEEVYVLAEDDWVIPPKPIDWADVKRIAFKYKEVTR